MLINKYIFIFYKIACKASLDLYSFLNVDFYFYFLCQFKNKFKIQNCKFLQDCYDF